LIRFDNAHKIKGHKKRDHKHMFENEAQEFEFITPKDLIDELLKLMYPLQKVWYFDICNQLRNFNLC